MLQRDAGTDGNFLAQETLAAVLLLGARNGRYRQGKVVAFAPSNIPFLALGAWILAPGDTDLVFSDDPEGIWQQALQALGGKYAPMSFIPEDPSLN